MENYINTILAISDDKPKEKETNLKGKDPVNDSAEDALSAIANIVLFLGIIASIGFLIFGDDKDRWIVSLAIFLPTITSWGLLKVISNISITLKDINSKIKKTE